MRSTANVGVKIVSTQAAAQVEINLRYFTPTESARSVESESWNLELSAEARCIESWPESKLHQINDKKEKLVLEEKNLNHVSHSTLILTHTTFEK